MDHLVGHAGDKTNFFLGPAVEVHRNEDAGENGGGFLGAQRFEQLGVEVGDAGIGLAGDDRGGQFLAHAFGTGELFGRGGVGVEHGGGFDGCGIFRRFDFGGVGCIGGFVGSARAGCESEHGARKGGGKYQLTHRMIPPFEKRSQ